MVVSWERYGAANSSAEKEGNSYQQRNSHGQSEELNSDASEVSLQKNLVGLDGWLSDIAII